jgi:hypothetical protein
LGSAKGADATGDPPSKMIFPSSAPLSRIFLVRSRVSTPWMPGTLLSFSHDDSDDDAFQCECFAE